MRRRIEREGADISKTNSKDVENGIRETIAALESEINSIATTLFGTEEFAKAATVVAEVKLRVRKVIEDRMAQQLARLNMPSREDVSALGEHLMTIDDRLCAIEEKLARTVPDRPLTKTKRPPRTKKPKSDSTSKS